MTNLSPAAQEVMDVYYCGAPLTGRDRVAAALRAAANIGDSYNCSSAEALDLIIAIAAELEGHD